ncbi:LytR C-terminal domain-containing protein [Arthrobacter sp. B0490]|uniref:LytR C-terminal domain-containing protein n=1 Tax=Arthrobacter sp. B0490 TaxID=2058891 RepID=UPI000CE539A5|nr:LytR C-terminal domain-containing protein [Arthrobacter sp. B0490]
MTDHPRDEFDRVPEVSARQGVHRERLIPAGSGGLGLKIIVGVLALLIGLGAYFLLPRLGFTGGGDGATAGLSTGAPAAAPTQEDKPSSDATGPGVGGQGSGEPDAGATSTADAGDPDRSQTVNVLNGTGSPGLASVAAARLASEGWVSVLPGNWAGVQLETSTVFYNGEEQRAAAEAVAADLGISTLTDSPGISPYISVVLGPEYR